MAARTTVGGRGTKQKPGALRRGLRGLLVFLLLLLLLLVGAAAFLQTRIDDDALRSRVEHEAWRQTGRTLTLQGLHLRLLPVPTIEATGIAFSNLPDFPRASMLTADGLSAHLALWPLLSHQIQLEGVTLTHPALVLRRMADGRANWQMHPPEVDRPRGDGTSSGHAARWRLAIDSLHVTDGALAWNDAVSGVSGAVSELGVEGSALSGARPELTLSGRHGGAGFQAQLQGGPLDRLLGRSPEDAPPAPAGSLPPWPLHLKAAELLDGRRIAGLSLDGDVSDPTHLRGYHLDLQADAAQLDGLNALFPKAALPAVADATLALRLDDAAPPGAPAATPSLGRLSLHTGAFQVGPVWRALLHGGGSHDLSVASLSLEARDRTSPLAVDATGTWRGTPASLRGTAGTLAGWQGGVPADVSLVVAAADARLRVDGRVSRGRSGGGAGAGTADLRLEGTVPDLRRLAGQGPNLTAMELSAHLMLPGRDSASVTDLHLDSKQLSLTGTVGWTGRAHPSITAQLQAAHLDVDALRAGSVRKGPAHKDADAAAPPPSSGRPDAAPSAPADGRHVLPFGALRLADLALKLTAGNLRIGGQTYRDAAAEVTLHDGHLAVPVLRAAGPAGPVAAEGEADAGTTSVSIALHPLTLPAELVAEWLDEPPALHGPLQFAGHVDGRGATEGALISSLSGPLGLSLVNGTVANNAVAGLVGAVPGVQAEGETAVRCLALPARLGSGQASLDPLVLVTHRLSVTGHGTVGLADGRLDLHLLPRLLIGSTGASLPVHVGGRLGAPSPALDPAAPGGRFALVIGGAAPGDPCLPALAAARQGLPGPMPAADTGGADGGGKRKLPKPIDILRRLGLFK